MQQARRRHVVYERPVAEAQGAGFVAQAGGADTAPGFDDRNLAGGQ